LNIPRVDLLAVFSPDKYEKVPIDDAKGLLRLLCFEPKQSVPLHVHRRADEYFYVIRGKGKITLGKDEAEVQSGCIVKAAAGVPHQWKNGPHRLILLSVLISTRSYELADESTEMEFV
jgi:quercetin dioxygenase-like cupin family protein